MNPRPAPSASDATSTESRPDFALTESPVQREELSLTELPEVSVVIPCLNEADTLATCIRKARRALLDHCISGEIIVADNGSTDPSPTIALREGARVVHVSSRGYGHALMGGIAAARGRFIIMGDADDSYDFLELPRLVQKLRDGYDLVIGCRYPAGGGSIMPGAMSLLHRRFGNPILTWLVRRWFGTQTVHDVYSGFRGFTAPFYRSLDLRCTGMEFAVEMIVKAALAGASITEAPITLHPDGRKSHGSHLRTLRDGWRTLRLFLLYSPARLFLLPGAALVLIGLLGYAAALPGLRVAGASFDAHTLLFASLAILCGYQAVSLHVFAKAFAITEGLLPRDPRLDRLFAVLTLERSLIVAASALIAGIALLASAVYSWWAVNFGNLDYAHTMRRVIPGVTLTALGFQTILSAFLLALLNLRRR